MIKRLAWIVLIAAAAAAGCLSGSGAVRGETVNRPIVAPIDAMPGAPGSLTPASP